MMHSIKLSTELTMKDDENNYPETAYNNHQIKIKWYVSVLMCNCALNFNCGLVSIYIRIIFKNHR